MEKELKIFTGNANPELAYKIASYLNMSVSEAEVSRFSDGEVKVKIKENVRGADVFVIQPTCPPVNENLMELLVMIDALKRASAGRITAVVPYYGYARQDRKVEPRVPITAKLVANLLVVAGADRVLTMDLHAGQIQGFFDIPVDHLQAKPVIYHYLKSLNLGNMVIVAPDTGGAERARSYARVLGADMAIIDKRRPKENESEVMNVVGDVKGKVAIIVDDMIDTAGTISKAAFALREKGAVEVIAAATHGVLSGSALENLEKAQFREIILTDTIPIPLEKRLPNMTILSVSQIFGEAIWRIHKEASVSSLFKL